MKLTNLQIFNHAQNYLSAFNNQDKIYLPAKVNYYIQSNMTKIIDLAKDVDKVRMDILQQYAELKNGSYDLTGPNSSIIQKELNDLFNIEQDIDIKTVSIDAFPETSLTMEQMNAIMFMID